MKSVVLFRGVNVGGHRKLPMAELRALAIDLGYRDPITYIQSGNLIIEHDEKPMDVTTALGQGIEKRFGFSPDMGILKSNDFKEVVKACPYQRVDDLSRVHVFFHVAEVPETSTIIPMPGDESEFVRSETAHYLTTPNGMSKSKLADILSRRLAKTTTARNLRTCTKLVGMLN